MIHVIFIPSQHFQTHPSMWLTLSASQRTGKTSTAHGPSRGTPRGPTTTSPSRRFPDGRRKYSWEPKWLESITFISLNIELVLCILSSIYNSTGTKFCFCLRSKDVNSIESGDNVNYVEGEISCFMRYSDLRDDNICKMPHKTLFLCDINSLFLFKSRIIRFLILLETKWRQNEWKSLIF